MDELYADSLPAAIRSMRRAWQDDVRANYGAARYTRFRRLRYDLGGGADAHYRVWIEYWRMREYARAMDRDDAVFGQMVDRAVTNILGTGLGVEPRTSDRGLNAELREAWEAWWGSTSCDVAGRHDGDTYDRLLLREVFVGGDAFVRLFDAGPYAGKLQWLEGDEITSPSRITDNVVYGVELGEFGRPVRYYQLRKRPDQWKWRRHLVPDVSDRSAYYVLPAEQVLHVYDPSRITQTRGVTAFHAVFDLLSMFEDINFAKMLQLEMTSAIAVFIQQERDLQFGPRDAQTVDGDATSQVRYYEKLAPGQVWRLRPNETVQGFAPRVPNPEYFEMVRLVLRLVGGALGLPLSIVLMSTADTTFHGYRGEMQQAYMGFRRVQRLLETRLRLPIYRWWARRFLERERGLRLPPDADLDARGRDLLRARVRRPSWPYVDPYKDAQADDLRMRSRQASPRTVVGERGLSWQDVAEETVEDRGLEIRLAIEEAREIAEATGEDVGWRDVLYRDPPKAPPAPGGGQHAVPE